MSLTLGDVEREFPIGTDRELDLRWFRYEIAAHCYTEARQLCEEIVTEGDLERETDEWRRVRSETVGRYRNQKNEARRLVLERYKEIKK